MPGPEDFLRSFSQQQSGNPPPGFFFDDEGNLFPEPVLEPGDVFDDSGTNFGRQGNPLADAPAPRRVESAVPPPPRAVYRASAPRAVRAPEQQSVSFEPTQRSIFDPQAIRETYTRAFDSPRRVKQELLAETLGRLDEIPNFAFDEQLRTQQAPIVARQVLSEAKSQGLNPRGSWRDATTGQTLADARDTIALKRDALEQFDRNRIAPFLNGANKVLENTGLKNIGSSVNAFLEGIKLPEFISDPLALRNPVVATDSSIQEGSFVNPQGVKFLKEFVPKPNSYGTTFASPFGTNVELAHSPGRSTYDVAFQGPFGYRQSNNIKKEINGILAEANWLESQGDPEAAATARNRAMNMQEMLNEPLRSPALRYTLGEALQSVPVGGTVTAAPIGAQKGARARIYSALTNDALATGKGITPNPERLPTDEEFRAYDEGRGYLFSELREANRNRGRIVTERLSPTTWKNVNKEEKVFDPGTLKDPMIRAAYNLPESADVTELRENPLGLFERTNRIDFTKPVITTESPIYKFRKGLKGGLGVGAADFIPSPEAIRDVYAGQPLSALRRTGESIVQGIPLAAAVGGTVAAAPILAPIAGATGTALTINALGAAGNEIVRQQTGEGVIPKVRQFLGTASRTGVASAPQPARPYVTPRLVQTKPVNPITQQIQNRLGLAASRFNPAKGEFGLSEILFGR